MSYYLGIDLGTTYTAAATEREGVVEALTLGNRTASVPSVVFLRDDGEILVGEAATRRAMSEPGRVGREFKRRVGDPTPIILGGTPYAAEMLMARMLRWSLDKVKEQQGAPPIGIGLTHPANWGPYKLDLLRQAVRQVDVDADLMLPEPVAAATFYASQRRLDPNAVVAVYDLGGGTFDSAMVRRKASGFEIIGSPEGIERLGGIDFDEAVYVHVQRAIGDALDQLDPEEPAAVAALARLRQECIDAKEALSSDTDVSIPVLLPNLQTEVRLTRGEFEDMIRAPINETIVALRRSIRSAKVSPDDINAVLLVGGSSRIPLVAQMVGAELGRPIAIDAHPKDAISFGAAIAVAQQKGQATPESVKTVLPRDQRPPPPTMATGTHRPAPPRPSPLRPAPPTAARPAPPTAAQPVAAHAAAARPSPPSTGNPARPAAPQPTATMHTPGATPSGGYPAHRPTTTSSGGGLGDSRTMLLIAIAVVAAALVIILVIMVSKGGASDENGDGDKDDNTTTTEEAGSDPTEAGYNDDIKTNFVDACVAEGGEGTEDQCACIYEEVEATMPFDDFVAYDKALREGETPENPPELEDAVAACT